MKVRNHHFRRFPFSEDEVGSHLGTLATEDDSLWPHEYWPPIKLDGGLVVGATGGHGPIRYTVQELQPDREVVFRFTGLSLLTWPLVFRPLHDALLEDALDKVAAVLAGEVWQRRRWSFTVRFLRRLLAGR